MGGGGGSGGGGDARSGSSPRPGGGVRYVGWLLQLVAPHPHLYILQYNFFTRRKCFEHRLNNYDFRILGTLKAVKGECFL